MPEDSTTRFEALAARDAHDLPLDEACLLIAAHADPGLDEEAERARLDRLAAGVHDRTATGIIEHLCEDLGFTGDRTTYHDARNSLLPCVLDRRQGIPISLAIVAMEVGRRCEVPFAGIGMPGHFLVQPLDGTDRFLDLFGGGAELDTAACQAIFRRLHPRATWDDSFLRPVSPRAIVARVLANLANSYRRAGQRADVVWALDLRLRLPEPSERDRAELVSTLTGLGRFDAAAAVLDAGREGPGTPAATRLRARLN